MGRLDFTGGVYEALAAHHYTDPAIFTAERSAIFESSWQVVGHQSDVPNPGDFRREEVQGRSLVLVHGQDGTLRVFYNSCPHRGHELVSQNSGCVKKFTCPYHAWTFDTAGRLRAVPHAGNFPGFDMGNHPLREVRSELFHGLVLVNFSADAPSFASLAQGIEAEFQTYAPHVPRLKRGPRTERVARANWKVVAENYNECYHCEVVHRTLTSGVVDPDHYRSHVFDWGIRHSSPARPAERQAYRYTADAAAHTDRFMTWWFYPLLSLQVYPGGMFNTWRWEPVSADETRVIVDWWLPDSTPSEIEQELIDQQRDTTFAEDWEIVEGVQRGLARGGYQPGPLVVDRGCSAMSEHPILGFRDWYLAKMGQGG